jgi:two-component system sensor histidine kinase TctE
MGDRALIGEMILNLVDNAIKYSPDGSVVTLGVHTQEREAHLIVEDNGPGIAEQNRQDVFERFVRLPNSVADGCGLGMAIVSEIIVKHGGTVTLADTKGGGLRVEVNFPSIKDESP